MVLCVWLLLVVNSSASDCLERLVLEMIYYVSRGTLNSLTFAGVVFVCRKSQLIFGCVTIYGKKMTGFETWSSTVVVLMILISYGNRSDVQNFILCDASDL